MKKDMSARIKRIFLWMSGAMACGWLAAGCANVGNPSGGPRDEDPPYLVSATPMPGAVNVKRPEMRLTFNELVNVKDAFSKVVVSPAGRPPRVSSLGRTVTVRFDSLADNTTYTIDFADAIEDNNEANKLQNFAYTFSTGPTIDSLRISGRVLGARDLEPRPGILVGVHEALSDSIMRADSIFMNKPLLRVAKADETGRFIIRGLAPGQYRVFALMDNDNDFRFTSDMDEVAFYDQIVTPGTEFATATDTTYTALGQVDTVTTRQRTIFLPNDVLLRTFISPRRTQFVSKYERNDSNKLFLKMNAPSLTYPAMRILGHDGPFPAIRESREGADSITMWLPTDLAMQDSIMMEVGYTRAERGKLPVEVLDTLKFIRKKAPAPKKKKKKEEEKISPADSIARITTVFQSVGSGGQEVYEPALIESMTPLTRLDTTMIHLKFQRDTVWTPVRNLRVYNPDPLAPRTLAIDFPWDYDTKYKVEIDSLAGTDIYGKPTRPFSMDLTTKKESDYCTLTLALSGLDPAMPALVELLDGSDKPLRIAPVENNRAFFPFLPPGKYYARVFEDVNGNGNYDTGDYESGLQPEVAYYYPKAINMKKNWDKEEEWDVFATPIDQQKPAAILKNKPKEPKRGVRRKGKDQYGIDEEEEEDYFDPTENPFEDEQTRRNRRKSQRNARIR